MYCFINMVKKLKSLLVFLEDEIPMTWIAVIIIELIIFVLYFLTSVLSIYFFKSVRIFEGILTGVYLIR
ncbi:hypothetical protein BBF96_07435 [Anoxybacter fermentans]|uniref:Uncharacterized protein n=1 Tax=Anoxybacter fermentans TaxID=1323375 RepID=A0A3Q9HQN2_9FIRM|nr:hypothetical protein BBF96_07435 [Anoxybacter fermentans]